MTTADLGTLKRLDPRTVWPHEAHDFTPWLAEHLDGLGEALGFDLELVERESAAGDFSADILAKDLGTGRTVVVENQLEPTDHVHLGQIITYAASLEAGAVVWVSPELREEHRQALDWLNRGLSGTTAFFGVVLELLQVDGSKPAINFRPVAFPNDWTRQATSRSRGELTSKQERYQQFFQQLLDELREKHKFTNARAGQPQGWYSFRSGVSGFTYGISFALGGRIRAELYIDMRDGDRNLVAFERLRRDADAIEHQFGVPLEWEPLETKRACRVTVYREGSIEDPDEKLEEYRAWAVQMMLRFKKVFGPRLQKMTL